METKSGLTVEQVTRLGDALIDTTKNVYRTAETIFGEEVDDEVFEDLKAHSKIFKCETCNRWQGAWNKVQYMEDTCVDCEE